MTRALTCRPSRTPRFVARETGRLVSVAGPVSYQHRRPASGPVGWSGGRASGSSSGASRLLQRFPRPSVTGRTARFLRVSTSLVGRPRRRQERQVHRALITLPGYFRERRNCSKFRCPSVRSLPIWFPLTRPRPVLPLCLTDPALFCGRAPPLSILNPGLRRLIKFDSVDHSLRQASDWDSENPLICLNLKPLIVNPTGRKSRPCRSIEFTEKGFQILDPVQKVIEAKRQKNTQLSLIIDVSIPTILIYYTYLINCASSVSLCHEFTVLTLQ